MEIITQTILLDIVSDMPKRKGIPYTATSAIYVCTDQE